MAFVGALAGWEWYARAYDQEIVLPRALSVLNVLPSLLLDPETWKAAWLTLQSFFLGYAIALLIGMTVGYLSARFAWVAKTSTLHLKIWLALPLSPLVPLMIGLFGISLLTRVALVVVFATPIISVNVREGLRNQDGTLTAMAQSLCVRPSVKFWRIDAMVALPEIMAGVRLGAARALVGMVVAELIIVSVGLGRQLNIYRGQFRSAEMYGVVIIILALGVAIMAIAKQLDRRLTAWSR